MGTWFRRVWHLINRPRYERELMREMRRASRDNARSVDGSATRIACSKRSRDAWGWNWLDDAIQDLAVGVRTLLQSPSFAVTATLILSFGIGLNVTLYQMLQRALAAAAGDQIGGSRSHVSVASSRTVARRAVPYPVAEFVEQNNAVLAAVMVESGIEHGLGPGRRQNRSKRRSSRPTGSTSSDTARCTAGC